MGSNHSRNLLSQRVFHIEHVFRASYIAPTEHAEQVAVNVHHTVLQIQLNLPGTISTRLLLHLNHSPRADHFPRRQSSQRQTMPTAHKISRPRSRHP